METWHGIYNISTYKRFNYRLFWFVCFCLICFTTTTEQKNVKSIPDFSNGFQTTGMTAQKNDGALRKHGILKLNATLLNGIDLINFMKPLNRHVPSILPVNYVHQHTTTESSIVTRGENPTLLSFFEKENKKEHDNEYESDLENEGDTINNSFNDIPLLSSLITGKEIEGVEDHAEESINKEESMSDTQSMFEAGGQNIGAVPTKRNRVLLNNKILNFELKYRPKPTILTQNFQMDLEDPGDDSNMPQKNVLKLPVFNTKYKNNTNGIDELRKSFYHLNGVPLVRHQIYTKNKTVKSEISENDNNDNNVKNNDNDVKNNDIQFVKVSPSSNAHCMDGSIPGYYLRAGYGDGSDKWIVHLHGGAWCYDLRSCLKRRKGMLGSTKNSLDEDMTGFFHGILSNDNKINPHFYNWNVAVLSYCDGGLFSGNRKKTLTGKKNEFYFQGREVLKSQLESLKTKSLPKGKEVILSGTSAGGLALVLQANYIKHFLPTQAKVRGLVDAGLFLDQDSVWNTSISSLQFKALYSLHRPTLSRKCLESQPVGKKYKCLFPQYALKYVNIPLYLVNSLYDHWQLSYLEGIYCVYDDNKCETSAHDRILEFRNKMYNALDEVVKNKNNTGVFANSCLAHGQVILDYTWSRVKINNKSISDSFYDWFIDNHLAQSDKKHFNADCKYPCNGSCPRVLAKRCVNNFIKASETRRRRDAELC